MGYVFTEHFFLVSKFVTGLQTDTCAHAHVGLISWKLARASKYINPFMPLGSCTKCGSHVHGEASAESLVQKINQVMLVY